MFETDEVGKSAVGPLSDRTPSCPRGVKLRSSSIRRSIASAQQPRFEGTDVQMKILGCTAIRNAVDPKLAKAAHDAILGVFEKNVGAFTATNPDMERGLLCSRLMLPIDRVSAVRKSMEPVIGQLEIAI